MTDKESRRILNGITNPGMLIQFQVFGADPISGMRDQHRSIVMPISKAGVQSLAFSLYFPTTGTSSEPASGMTRIRYSGKPKSI
jgi:hypothetical protein